MTKKVKLTKFEAELTRTEEQFAANDTVYPSEIVCITDGGDNDGRVKVTDGVHTWSELEYEAEAEGGDGSPGGSSGEIQFNNGGSFGGKDDDELSTFLDGATDPFLRTSASTGKAFGIPMTYSNAVIGAPAEGVFRFDSVTAGSIANAFWNMTAPTGVDNAGLWSLNNPQRGYVQVTHGDGKVLVMQMNGDGIGNTGVYEVPMVHVSGPLPANGEVCRVLYTPGPAETGSIAIVDAGALVRQSTALWVPFSGIVNAGGGGDGGVAPIYLTTNGLDGGANLFSSLIGKPTITVTDPANTLFATLQQIAGGVHRIDIKVVDQEGTNAPDDTPVDIWVCGIPA